MLRSLYTLRLFLRKFHNFIDAWGERGLAYIINPPIPGKTCFELTARHKNRLLWRGWKSRKKIIFTSFLGQFPCDDTLSVDSHLHYSSCVCLLSVTPSFWFRQELVPCSNFPCILFWDSWFYCQCSMCWVSKLLLLSYYCGNVCLSPPFERWPLPEPADQSGPVEPGNAVVFFCPGPRYIRNIIPFSGENSLWCMWSDARVCLSSVPWCMMMVTMSDRNHLLWDEGGWPHSSNNCLCLAGASAASAAGDQWLARGTEPHWVTTLRLLAIAAPARHIAGNGRPLPLAMPGTSSGQHSDCPAGVTSVHTLTRHAQKICQWTVRQSKLLSSLGWG